MGTHPIFESDFDCLTDMGPLYIDVICLHIVQHDQTTVPVFISGSIIDKTEPSLRDKIEHDGRIDLFDVPNYEDFFNFIQDGKVTIGQHNRAGLAKTASYFRLGALTKLIKESLPAPVGRDYLEQREITLDEYRQCRDKFDPSEDDDRFNLDALAESLPRNRPIAYGNDMDDQLTMSDMGTSIRTEAMCYHNNRPPAAAVPNLIPAPRAQPTTFVPPPFTTPPITQPAPDPTTFTISSQIADSQSGSPNSQNFINQLQEYCVDNSLAMPIYPEEKGADQVWEVKCVIKDSHDTVDYNKDKHVAKREAARKMLEIVKQKEQPAPCTDEAKNLDVEIKFFHDRLLNNYDRPIEAFKSVQKNDGRSVYQHLSCSSQFHCVELVEVVKFDEKPGMFICSIKFNVCHKQQNDPTTHRRQMTIHAKHFRKKQAEKAAWNKVISIAYTTLSSMTPEPVLTNQL